MKVLTEEQEKRLCEDGYFLYHGYHFKPLRRFTTKEDDFFKITSRLKYDREFVKAIKSYSWKGFYAASPEKEVDIFYCYETAKEYVPCDHELQEYLRCKE